VYLSTLSSVFVSQDTPEFIAASVTLGVGHPPGYPMFLLLGKLFSFLPLRSIAYRVNLLTAILGVVATVLAYAVSRRFLRSALPPRTSDGSASRNPAFGAAAIELLSVAVALLVAFSSAFWSYTVFAEVYSLQMVSLLALVLLAFKTADEYPEVGRWFCLLCFTMGLALTVHTTMVIYAPAVLVLLLPKARVNRIRHLTVVLGAVLFLVGLSVYLYLPVRAATNPPINIGDPRTPRAFVELLTGRMYYEVYQTPLKNLALSAQFFLASLFSEFPLFSPPLALLGALFLGRRNCRLLLASLLVLAANLGFFGCLNQQAAPTRFYFPNYVFVPAYWIWALWMALGILSVGETVARAAGRRPGRAQRMALALPVIYFSLLPLFALGLHYRTCDASRLFYRYDLSDYIFRRLKPGAIVLSTDTVKIIFPLWYFQQAEHRYRDIQAVAPSLEQWNLNNIRRTPGLRFPTRTASLPPMSYARLSTEFFREFIELNSVTHPIYVSNPDTTLTRGYHLVPDGYLFELSRRRPDLVVQDPSIRFRQGVSFSGNVRMIGYDLDAERVRQGGDFTLTLFWTPTGRIRADYSSMLELTDPGGEPVARVNYPDVVRPLGLGLLPSSRWEEGQIIREQHSVFVPSDLVPGTYGLNLAVGDSSGLLDVQETQAPRLGKFARIADIQVRLRGEDRMPE
jgi:hypothetical protein